MARLVVNPDSADAWAVELRPDKSSLGRSENNDIQIEHSSVSSSHCEIEVSGGGARIRDLGSTSGTFVEGQLIEDASLQPGQVFCMGDVRLRFEAESASGPMAMPAARSHASRSPAGAKPVSAARPPLRFAACACGAFVYPLAKDGWLLLVTGAILLSIIEAGKYFARFAAAKGIGLGSAISLAFLLLLTVFGVGYLVSYLRRVITSTAMGDQAAPDWPELTNFLTDILSPLFQLAVTVAASLAPAIIVGMFVPGNARAGQVAVSIACGLGGLYFPMAFLAVVMFDSLAALNPLLVVPSITRVPGCYLFTVVLLAAVLAAKWCGDYFLPKLIPIPIVPFVFSTLVGLYLLMVNARVLGLLYLANKDRLAWFGHR
jgi:hypothetical protein